MEQFAIYLWSISENLQILLASIGGFGVVIGAMLALGLLIDQEEYPKIPATVITVGVISLILAALIPDKRDLAVILLYPAAKEGVQKVVQSETAQQLHEVGRLYLPKKIKELKTND